MRAFSKYNKQCDLNFIKKRKIYTQDQKKTKRKLPECQQDLRLSGGIMATCIFFILFFFNLLFYLFVNLWLFGVFSTSWAFLQLWQVGAALHFGAQASHYSGCFCCRAQVLGCRLQELPFQSSRAQAQSSCFLGLVALWRVGSSQLRHQTHVPFIGRWILCH